MRTVSLARQRLNRIRRQLLDPLIAEGAPCEVNLEGCGRRATDGHEVKTRARGGSIVDPRGITLVCRPCHIQITRNSGKSGWAVRHGWVVASWATEDDESLAAHLRTVFRCPLSCEEDHRIRHPRWLRCTEREPCDGSETGMHLSLFGECWAEVGR